MIIQEIINDNKGVGKLIPLLDDKYSVTEKVIETIISNNGIINDNYSALEFLDSKNLTLKI